jgi:HAE1 family hydrophobic/amphiphilic exporter-1
MSGLEGHRHSHQQEQIPERGSALARFAVDRRVTISMIAVGLVVLGYVSLTRLPLEFLPSFGSNSLWVSVDYESSSPEETERLIVRPLEQSLGTIPGITVLTATARAESGNVSVEFDEGADMDLMVVEARDRVDRIRHLLPDDIERIRIRRFQSTDIPILQFHLGAPWERERLFDFAEDIVQPRLERLEGVASVDVRGVRRRELRVSMDQARMAALNVDVRDIATVLSQSNVNVSGGTITDGSQKFIVRTVGEFQRPEDIRETPIGGTGLRLSDVADVTYEFPTQTSFDYLNGEEAVTFRIYKASNANVLEVADGVKAEMSEIAAVSRYADIEMRYIQDSSLDVRGGLSQLALAGLFGGGLAMLILLLFLQKVRTTLLVAVAIPLSIITTFVIMYLGRQAGLVDTTLNVISLFGLMVAVGMLADPAIVVIDSISRHFTEYKEDSRTAAIHGASAVTMPIIAGAATTMCVFVPLVFLGATMGGFFRIFTDFGFTLSVVIVASLLVALTVVPMMAGVVLRNERRVYSRTMRLLGRLHGKVIRRTLQHRFVSLTVAIGLLGVAWVLYQNVERSSFSTTVEREVTINVDVPRAYSLDETREVMETVAALIEERRDELEIADVVYEFRRGGGRQRGGFGGGGRRFELYLVDETEGERSVQEITDELREMLPTVPGVNFRIAESRGRGPGGGGGIRLDLKGDDMDVLELVSARVVERLSALPWIRDVDTSLESGTEELHVTPYAERALASGAGTFAVAQTVRSALTTRPAGTIESDQREVDIVVQYPEEQRERLDHVRRMPVFVGEARVPVGAMADFETVSGPRSIEREDRRPKLTISANTTTPGASFRLMGQVQEQLADIALPPGYEWSFDRWSRMGQTDFSAAGFAFAFALLLIYLIMVALFESFLHPAVIMFSIPFSFIGVAVTLKLTGQTLGNTAMLGLVLLAGIVVNNAIVLIAHVNTLRKQGMSRDEALVLGSEHRLRPVMMTALTTFCGLMPLAAPYFLPELFGSVDGRAGQWAPIGLVLAGGLPTSTLLTLLLVPTIYAVTDDLKRLVWPYTTAPAVAAVRQPLASAGTPALNPVTE